MSLISLSAAVNNMDLSVLCLLTVALAFVPLNSAKLVPFPVEKSGECPNTLLSLADPFAICLAQCSSDSDCKGTMKCCQMGCRRMCMEPKKVIKPGSCPRPDRHGICDLPDCHSDSDCENDQKCCFNGCGRTCLDPVVITPFPVEKPGECPNPIISLPDPFAICLAQCSSDSDCKGTMKCCQMGCRRMCMEPKKVIKPGSCPRPDRHGICDLPDCHSDSDCENDQKCCFNGCGRTCLDPVGINLGNCPRSGPLSGIRPINCDKCFNDNQCPSGLICCSNQCSIKTCMRPVGVICPRLHFVMCEDECRDDSQCSNHLRCCYNECEGRKICMKPRIGPIPTLPIPTRTKPTLVKAGACPRVKPHLQMCENECSNDQQCPMDKKCCFSGCGLQCLTPLSLEVYA